MISIWSCVGILCALLDIAILWSWTNKKYSWIELVSKLFAVQFFLGYLAYRIGGQWQAYILHPSFFSSISLLNWSLVMLQLLLYVFVYIVRNEAGVRANRWYEYVIPVLCVVFPFGLIESVHWIPMHSWWLSFFKPFYIQSPSQWNILSILLILLGDLLILWALYYLRSSFSIFTEVRAVICRGPYRWLRHPMYLGEIFSMIGICLLAPSWFNGLLVLMFIIFIGMRATIEERKLVKHESMYVTYRKRTGFLWPKILRRALNRFT